MLKYDRKIEVFYDYAATILAEHVIQKITTPISSF